MAALVRTGGRVFYGWAVVMAAFAINAIALGVRYSFGVFFKSLEAEFGLNRTATSAVFSTYMVLCAGIAVLGGWLLDRHGPRKLVFTMALFTVASLLLTGRTTAPWQLFITYSVLLALGTGAMYVSLMSTISRWFEKKRGLALGIAGSGVGLGTVVMAPFATFLISTSNWRTAFSVVGAVAVLIVPLSLVLKRDPGQIGALPDGLPVASTGGGARAEGPPSLSMPQVLRSRSFWYLWMINLLWAVCFHIVLTHLVPHATDLGISPAQAALLLGSLSLISIPGRLVIGGVSDRIGRKTASIMCALVQAVGHGLAGLGAGRVDVLCVCGGLRHRLWRPGRSAHGVGGRHLRGAQHRRTDGCSGGRVGRRGCHRPGRRWAGL